MRPPVVLQTESDLGAGGPPAAADRTCADGPGRGSDGSEADGGLARRLARLPAAHPSARSHAGRSDGVRSDAGTSDAVRSDGGWGPAVRDTAVRDIAVRDTADWADRRPGGDRASEGAWWRGESDIWWRVPDGLAGKADYDEAGGLRDSSEPADADDDPCAGCPGGTGGLDDVDGAAETDATRDTDDQGGGTGGRPVRRTAGPAGRGPGQQDVHPGDAGGPRSSQHGSYRPWFSPDVCGDPWFAAGLD